MVQRSAEGMCFFVVLALWVSGKIGIVCEHNKNGKPHTFSTWTLRIPEFSVPLAASNTAHEDDNNTKC
jgi:hypothetical protein